MANINYYNNLEINEVTLIQATLTSLLTVMQQQHIARIDLVGTVSGKTGKPENKYPQKHN